MSEMSHLSSLQDFCFRILLTGLSLHGTNTRVLEEQPIVHLIELAGAGREADLVVFVVLCD